MTLLSEEQKRRGVVTATRGNQGQGVALAGRLLRDRLAGRKVAVVLSGSNIDVETLRRTGSVVVEDFVERERGLGGVFERQAFERRRELGQQTAALAQQVSTPPAPPGAKGEEIESAFEARWMGGDLVLLRRIRRGDERLLQGTVLDWPALRELLLARVEAVVPASRLEAIGEREEADPGRRLALVPARLVPGPMRETEPKNWMPLRLSIAAAWLAALLGLVGIGSLLKGAMTLSQRRADFVSAVTHELRTPLTTFRLYTEMLADGMVPAEERPSYLATLKREADRLGHLIENVLAFSRLERRTAAVRMESLPLADLLDRTVPRLQERASQEGLGLRGGRELRALAAGGLMRSNFH